MAIKDWYKLTFLIESDSEEMIIWKLNELGIFSFSFEYLIKNENKTEKIVFLNIFIILSFNKKILFHKSETLKRKN